LIGDLNRYFTLLSYNSFFVCCRETVICIIVLSAEYTAQKCKIIFYEDSSVEQITIRGESDDFPDLSDAVTKFENFNSLILRSIRLRTVERSRLSALTKIKVLDLGFNEITRLDGDTFNDLKNLTELRLANRLQELHVDLFKELQHLDALYLHENRLEFLTVDIFANNKKLRRLYLTENQLKEIHENHFKDLLCLEVLHLDQNQLKVLPAHIFQNNKKLKELKHTQQQK